jgi:hypothetical protein
VVLFFKFFHSPLLPGCLRSSPDAINDSCTLYDARRSVIECRRDLFGPIGDVKRLPSWATALIASLASGLALAE